MPVLRLRCKYTSLKCLHLRGLGDVCHFQSSRTVLALKRRMVKLLSQPATIYSGLGPSRREAVHLIVSAGGYRETDQEWVAQAALLQPTEKVKLMRSWRNAVLRRLRLVSEKGIIQGDCRDQSYIDFIDRERQDWQVSVSLAKDRKQAMEYAMRYTKHPPVSSRRIVNFSNVNVSLLCHDMVIPSNRNRSRSINSLHCSLGMSGITTHTQCAISGS